MTEKSCIICGILFQVRRNDKTCSVACRQVAAPVRKSLYHRKYYQKNKERIRLRKFTPEFKEKDRKRSAKREALMKIAKEISGIRDDSRHSRRCYLAASMRNLLNSETASSTEGDNHANV